MGSSAGGIIALAISTGINPIEVEHICYTMNQIPSNDRFDFIKDDQKIGALMNIGKLLNEYGLVNNKIFMQLVQFLRKPEHKDIEEKIVNVLDAVSPTIGQILKLVVENENDKQVKLNLAGLLGEGALMKGDAIYTIGSQCLIRYFLKETSYLREETAPNTKFEQHFRYTFSGN